ncbi:hypothetical protein BX600DRAFT_52670 [Xylariales sp. PMI_506]|nr:hypothetical protein BX600DRAFT_52670 [Xylariales sp. PMI_506]
MPRTLNEAACDTCRKRKVKCDEQTPVCGQCSKSGRYCDRSMRPTRFVYYSAEHGASSNYRYPSPDEPSKCLQSPELAAYFHHYITDPAKWYDLGDRENHFSISVPEEALREPLLMSAILALSAMHIAQTSGKTTSRGAAEIYHGHCVRLLICLEPTSPLLKNGVALAAACLLRSYEILNGVEDPQTHLRGVYSLVSHPGVFTGDPSTKSLLEACFWNYLREDITFSLFESCPLKIDLGSIFFPGSVWTEGNHLNSVSIILGQIINAAFGNHLTDSLWVSLVDRSRSWFTSLPAHLQPYSTDEEAQAPTGSLPRIWFLQDFHGIFASLPSRFPLC